MRPGQATTRADRPRELVPIRCKGAIGGWGMISRQDSYFVHFASVTLRPMSDVPRLIDAAATGDPRAAADLLPLVYAELPALAGGPQARGGGGGRPHGRRAGGPFPGLDGAGPRGLPAAGRPRPAVRLERPGPLLRRR